MKTFKEFNVESRQYLEEVAPLVAAAGGLALKGLGAGLAAYSAYDAVKQARKGNYGRAAFSALGAIPGAGIFKGAKLLSKSNKIAKGARNLSSVNKFAGPEGRNVVFNALGKNKVAKNNNKTNTTIANNNSTKPTKNLSLADTTFKKTGSKTYGV